MPYLFNHLRQRTSYKFKIDIVDLLPFRIDPKIVGWSKLVHEFDLSACKDVWVNPSMSEIGPKLFNYKANSFLSYLVLKEHKNGVCFCYIVHDKS